MFFRLFARLARFFRSSTAAQPSPASALMEAADHLAGHNNHDAQELRDAASAWLRVVR